VKFRAASVVRACAAPRMRSPGAEVITTDAWTPATFRLKQPAVTVAVGNT